MPGLPPTRLGLFECPGSFGEDQLFRFCSGIGTKAINLSVAFGDGDDSWQPHPVVRSLRMNQERWLRGFQAQAACASRSRNDRCPRRSPEVWEHCIGGCREAWLHSRTCLARAPLRCARQSATMDPITFSPRPAPQSGRDLAAICRGRASADALGHPRLAHRGPAIETSVRRHQNSREALAVVSRPRAALAPKNRLKAAQQTANSCMPTVLSCKL